MTIRTAASTASHLHQNEACHAASRAGSCTAGDQRANGRARADTALTAIAREALAVYERGCPGFRPRSAILRQQRDTTLARAVAECQQMATAWRAGGLTTRTQLPVWLNAALSDSDTQRSQSAGAAAPA